MITHENFLTEIEHLERLLSEHPYLCFDTEFVRETTFFPEFELLQIAVKKTIFLFDMQNLLHHKVDCSRLIGIFQNKNILKIGHAVYGDQECFYYAFGITVFPVFDTSIAYSLISSQEQISLSMIIEQLIQVKIKKGLTRVKWDIRPLSSDLLDYATQDVLYLDEVYFVLKKMLNERYSLGLKFSNTTSFIKDNPYDLALKYAKNQHLSQESFNVFVGLISWREKIAREKNHPRRTLISDAILVDLSKSTPSSLNELKSFRGLKHSFLERYGADLIEVIQNSKEIMQEKKEDKKIFLDKSLLQSFLMFQSVLSSEIRIAQRWLLSAHDIACLFQKDLTHMEVDPEVWTLIKDKVIDFIDGKLALRLHQNKIEYIKL